MEEPEKKDVVVPIPEYAKLSSSPKDILKPLVIRDSLLEQILERLEIKEITAGVSGWYEGKEGFKKIVQLELAYSMGATDAMACDAAGITLRQLQWYEEEINPEFRKQKAIRKSHPSLKALVTIYENLDDVEVAQWYLSKKMKSEFGDIPPIIPTGNQVINLTKGDTNNIYTQEMLEIDDKDSTLIEEVKDADNQTAT